jgi:uncharacterized protein (TIGR02145 family)
MKHLFFSTLLLFILITSCKKSTTNSSGTGTSCSKLPGVTTSTVTSITATSAEGGGVVDGEVSGVNRIEATGICWNTSPNPIATGSNSTSFGNGGAGGFTVPMFNLTPNTVYHVRAFALNCKGYAYGSDVTFKTTTVTVDSNTVTDIDGNIYHYIVICGHTWLKENLKTTHYRNGDFIIQGSNGGLPGWPLDSGAYTFSDFDPTNNDIYGKLYNGYAVNDPRGLAPVGWHIPTDEEWDTLVNCLGGDAVAGGKMKASTLWAGTQGSNESGFSALPADMVDQYDGFEPVGYYAYFWSYSGNVGDIEGWIRQITFTYDIIYRTSYSSLDGASVRCIKDY